MVSKTFSRLSFARWDALPESVVRRAFWTFAGVLLGLRLLVLAVIPLDLSGDEAYYWEWGRHLDWGYFSKPPGIAWLMALAGWIGGDTTFGVRLFAALLGTGSLAFMFLLALRLYGPAVAMITAIAFVANPANAALNFTLTIDAPLMFFWTLALLAFWQFIQPGARSGKWGGLLLLALTGGLLSKQMMLVFHPLAVLFLIVSKDYRSQLRRPALWGVMLGSLVALLPPLWWNLRNEWITVHHTLHHFESGTVSPGRQAGRFLEYVGSQFGIITPVIYVLLMALVVAAIGRWRRLGDRERFLWLLGGPALLVILLLGLRQRINPNWPAVFYASTLVLVVAWAAGQWSLELKLDRWRRVFAPGLKLGIGCAVTVYLVAFALSLGLMKLPGLDPTARLRGWSQLARDVDAVRRERPGGRDLPIITQGHRFLTSELAFHLPDQPRVYLFNSQPDRIASQYDLWETPAAHLGRDALLIVQGGPETLSAALTNRFESVSVQGILHYPQQSGAPRMITLAVGRNLRHWPGLED